MEQRFATALGSIHRFGRTQNIVRCTCGHENRFFRWSWAGHGKARCKGCSRFISYHTLAVFGKGK